MFRLFRIGPIFALLVALMLLSDVHSQEKKKQMVMIKGFAFNPQTITINVGDSIVWTNKDGAVHTATSDDKKTFDTGDIKGGKSSKEIVFTKAGEFPYHCIHHPSEMKGKVVVKSK
jgi:plastocyanin